MILLPDSFISEELTPSIFSKKDVLEALKKVFGGIGISIRVPGIANAQIKKIAFTTASGHARMITLLITKDGIIFPLLLRSKKDKVGENMSIQNPLFLKEIFKMYDKIRDDIEHERFECIKF